MRGARRAVAEGIARTRLAWRAVVAAWLSSLVIALPLASVLYVALRDHLGHSASAENLRVGWDDHWHRAFAAQAEGIEKTFDAGIVGIGAVLRALDAQITGTLWSLPGPVLAAALVYALVWVVLSGGFLQRFVHGSGGAGAFAVGAVAHAPRLLGLALAAAAAYWMWLSPGLAALDGLVRRLTIDTIDERVAFAWTVGKYAVVWGGVWTVSLLHDYAKLHAVADPKVTIWTAIGRAARTLRRRTVAVFGTSALVAGLGLAGLAAYWVIAPDSRQSNGLMLLIAFGFSQLSVLLRIAVRVAGWASAAALLQLGPDARTPQERPT